MDLPTTLAEIEQIGGQLPSLGVTVFWRLSGVSVAHDDLAVALLSAGFDRFLPKLPTPRASLRRALAEWIKARQTTTRATPDVGVLDAGEEPDEDEGTSANSTRKRRALIRVINQPYAPYLVFALVAEDVDFVSLGLSYGTQIRIKLDKKTGLMVCSTDAVGTIEAENESQWLADQLRPYWDRYRTVHVSGDLSRMMREIVHTLSAVSLRREGGLYFVPMQHYPALERLRQLVGRLPAPNGGQPFVCALPVPDVPGTRKQMAHAAHAGFLDELGAMRHDLDRFLEATTGTVKAKTLAERLTAYKRLRGKAQTYADLLGMQQDDIAAHLHTLEEQAKTLLAIGAPASETSPTDEVSAAPPVDPPSEAIVSAAGASGDDWDIGE